MLGDIYLAESISVNMNFGRMELLALMRKLSGTLNLFRSKIAAYNFPEKVNI